MSDITLLDAELRDRAGKGAARASRRAGRVPAVIYGNKQEPLLISVEPKALHRELHKSGFFARLFNIQVTGEKHLVIARDIQLDPVTDVPLHVDFLRVGADATIVVEVPVHFKNQEKCPGLKSGGVLNVVRHELELDCRVNNIPAEIVIDLINYKIGDSIHISMVELPEGAKSTITDRDFTIATIVPPTTGKTDDEAAAPAAPAAA